MSSLEIYVSFINKSVSIAIALFNKTSMMTMQLCMNLLDVRKNYDVYINAMKLELSSLLANKSLEVELPHKYSESAP